MLAPLQLAPDNGGSPATGTAVKPGTVRLSHKRDVGIKERMHLLCWLILLTAAYPLWRAWQANRRTSLVQAVHWAIIAWAGWGGAFSVAHPASFSATVARSFMALGFDRFACTVASGS